MTLIDEIIEELTQHFSNLCNEGFDDEATYVNELISRLETAKERMPKGLGEALLGVSGESIQSDRIKERKAADVAQKMFGDTHG